MIYIVKKNSWLFIEFFGKNMFNVYFLSGRTTGTATMYRIQTGVLQTGDISGNQNRVGETKIGTTKT